jgi:osmotically inducible protein OsmC
VATDRKASVVWQGDLMNGSGAIGAATSGAFPQLDVSWPSRAEEPNGRTSPEELIAAAHSSCFSMALAHGLTGAGHEPSSIDTTADVMFQPGEGITGIHLSVRAQVDGISAEEFDEAAQAAKAGCPVSQALAGTTITLDAELGQ